MILTYSYRVKDARRSVRRILRAQARSVNFIWNYCCQIDREAARRYKAGLPVQRPTAIDLIGLCYKSGNKIAQELGIHSETISMVCRKFVSSRNAIFPKTPRYRSFKKNLDWVPLSTFHQAGKLVGDRLRLLKRYYRLWIGRKIPEIAKMRTWNFACNSEGKWFVNFQIEMPDGQQARGESVGIDLGLKSLATLSDGTKIRPPQFYRSAQAKLALYQRRRQKKKARRLSAKIARQRRNFLHVESTRIARKFGFIAVGDVSASKLKKTQMAKSVSDAGWAMFRTMLQYKSIATGARCLIVREAYSSQVCSECGSLPDSRPRGYEQLGIRHWVCSDCGASLDRDVNAARNILRVGFGCEPRVAEI